MNTDLYRSTNLIGHNATLRVPHAQGRTVLCASGRVWLTQYGDAQDVFLEAGQSFTLDRPGDAILQAVGGGAAVVILDGDDGEEGDRHGTDGAGRGLAATIDRVAATLNRAPHWQDPAHPARISREQIEEEARQMRAATLRHLAGRAAAALRRLGRGGHDRGFAGVPGVRP